MIIGLCGRCRSGKTELAKVCENYGYKRLYFALPLKELCAKLLNMSIDELNKAKVENTTINFDLNINEYQTILSEDTNIPIEVIKEKCNEKIIKNVREMLQFIGTDIIREYNIDWHVNKLKELINKEEDYIFDDVRFPNEKKMIEDFGGDCWFVTRPTLDNISNHESETSITWNDCWNKIIINDCTLPYLLFKWEIFIDNYERSRTIRDREFNRILENGIENEIKTLSTFDVMMLSKHLFTYTPREFDKENIDSIQMNEDKTVFIKYKDGTMEFIENALAIEDIKLLM